MSDFDKETYRKRRALGLRGQQEMPGSKRGNKEVTKLARENRGKFLKGVRGKNHD